MPSDRFAPRQIDWTPELVRRFWDHYSSNPALADTYFTKSLGPHLIDYIAKRIRIGTAVDFGCGRGDLIGHLLPRYECYGVDQSPESVEGVNQRFGDNPNFKGAFVGSGQLPDASADTVFAVEVIEHMDDASIETMLREARRILKPGGHLVLTTPNDEDLRASEIMCPSCGCIFHRMQHVRSWSAQTLERYVASFGFDGRARATMLSRRRGIARSAHEFLHRLLRFKFYQLIYIGTAVAS